MSQAARRPHWHTVCLWLGCGGCFYVPPLPDVDVNQRPVIAWPTQDPYPVVIRQQDQVTLSLRASDADGDEITCDWPDLDNFVYEASQTTDGGLGQITACRVTVYDPQPLVGKMVEALVTDGDRDNLVTVRFAIEALP